ncbi:type II toxin-antitoxin system VapC family toxin [Deinococcus sp. YIM 134068]|uniref:type II toxin-antitoxin system VapC family toxin n=1 Tax=Deinococcus lichenicola TaxID=3118910 RepID=UPI002F956699
MRVSLDTNIIVGIWSGTPEGQRDLLTLQHLQQGGDELLVCGVVYTELCAHPGMNRSRVDAFLTSTNIDLDSSMPPTVWADAADVNHAYQVRRRRGGVSIPKRVVPDFLIGAHALHRADRLMTRNGADFNDFPTLTLFVPVP